mgnify:CR=1 FL=1
MHDKQFRIALYAVIFTFLLLGGAGTYDKWTKTDAKAAQAPAENCEQYYAKAMEYGKQIGRVSAGIDDTAAQGSTAFSLLYQNCVARQSKR